MTHSTTSASSAARACSTRGTVGYRVPMFCDPTPTTSEARDDSERHCGTDRLRVAFVLAQLGPGGTESQAELLVRGLRSRGHDVDVYAMKGHDRGSSAPDDVVE